MQRFLLLILLAAFTFAAPVAAEEQRRATSPCSTPEYRQFDYWLGDWEVFNDKGEKIGENRVTREQGGCVLHEHWTDARGGTGESFNMYDAPRGVWHQTWVAESGQLLLLEGGLNDKGRMVLSGERDRRDGQGKVIDRITWTPNPDGTVRQLWESSVDGGKTWSVVFDGLYRKISE